MTQCLMTAVSADGFAHYIPLYIYAIRTWSKDVDIRIYVRGAADDMTDNAMIVLLDKNILMKNDLVRMSGLDLPMNVSTINTMRFLIKDDLTKYDQVLITDVDLMLFKDPFQWHLEQMRMTGLPFAGHHGPTYKPHRPEIAPSWTGDFERVAGGFFCVTPEWFDKTEKAREKYRALLKDGAVGAFRESDEVTLARITKESGFPAPKSKHFPPDIRGLHLGDFKKSMSHRWINMVKMRKILTDETCDKFLGACGNTDFIMMMEKLVHDADLMDIIANVRMHIRRRRNGI